jgi:hypothetical protein
MVTLLTDGNINFIGNELGIRKHLSDIFGSGKKVCQI